MPKLPKSEQQKRDDNFRAVISGNLEKVHITRKQLGERLGISNSTMIRRWKNPDEFTRYDLRRICNILNISVNTLLNSDTM